MQHRNLNFKSNHFQNLKDQFIKKKIQNKFQKKSEKVEIKKKLKKVKKLKKFNFEKKLNRKIFVNSAKQQKIKYKFQNLHEEHFL